MTTRTFRPYEPDDLWLVPPSPQDWLPEDPLAYFLADLVEALNLDPILAGMHTQQDSGTHRWRLRRKFQANRNRRIIVQPAF